MMCIATTSLSFLVNGSPISQINPKRGIRQGGPLSPYIFALLMQNLTILINKRVETKQISTFKKHNNIMGISYLIYIDDVLIFCRSKKESFKSINEVFRLFEERTRLRVNEAKSEVFFSNSTIDKDQLLNHLRFKEGIFSTKYLRLPLSSRIFYFVSKRLQPINRPCKWYGRRMKDKVWKTKLLSHVGRVQLFHWGVMGIFNFWNMLSRLSIETLKELQSISYRHIWNWKQDFTWV